MTGTAGSLDRYIAAQENTYEQALGEIRAGWKRTHWMWFVFPQLAGLGMSPTAQFYALSGLDEAAAYLAHPVLGPRLIEICRALLALPGSDALDIFGYPDNLKLRSCVTLFGQVPNADPVFQQVLDRFYAGQPDARTLELLA